MYGARIPTSAAQPSNRQRLRDADRAVALQEKDHVILLAVLAQSGGEVTVTEGTIGNLTPDMTYAVVDSPQRNEKIIRLVMGYEDIQLQEVVADTPTPAATVSTEAAA